MSASDPSRKPQPGLTSWRSVHRSRSHDSAHAEDHDLPPEKTIDHPMVPRGHADLITTQTDLDNLILELRSAGSFAYDTEFIGELTYHPMLCVIQVATTQRVALVDPMVELDLRGFWELLADPNVEKIVHAGEQDVEPVARNLGEGRGAQNVIDTQIAAGFVGMAYPVALSKLVHEVIGVKLGKGLTFTHWDQRPLSNVQLRYAADDVRYLPAIWDNLRDRLDAAGHRAWTIEECAAMCEPSRFGFHPESSFLRIRGSGTLSNNGLAILRELTIWRDAAARQANVPSRALVKDDILIDMARSPIKDIDKLSRVRGLPRPVEAEHRHAIVEATLRALDNPPARLASSRMPEPTPTERFRADSLYAAACVLCAAKSLDPALAASRADIVELHARLLRNEPLDDLSLMIGWRREALGEPLLQLVQTKHPLHAKWQDGQLRE